MEAYGKLLGQIHSIQLESLPAKPRKFALSPQFYAGNNLKHVEHCLSETEIEDTKCFIHGDCHYANILWKNGQVSGLLDFEPAGHGSREYDLAWALVLRPGQGFLKTKEERQAVLDAYSRPQAYSRGAFEYYLVRLGMFFTA